MASAIDGDSLRLNEEEIRLTGIDAPEFAQTCGPRGATACGRQARQFLADLLRRGPLVCEPEGEDRYRRTLARCFLDEEDIAAMVVRAGHAVARDSHFGAQTEARNARRGIWAGPFEDPADWRESRRGESGRG
jgi:endonuclease YncB( thermonuclease family)